MDDRRNFRTPLLWAVGRGDLEVVEELLEDPRTSVNWPNLSGSTPLFEACFCTIYRPNHSGIELIIQRGK